MTEQEVVARIHTQFPEAQVRVSGADCQLTLSIVSQGFSGMGLLARHRAIQALFKDALASGELHALSLVTQTPEEVGTTH